MAAGAAMIIRSVPSSAGPSTKEVVTPPLSLFDYAQVQLQGPLRQQFDYLHNLLFHLDEDALLKPFRQRSGMPASGPDMGGWYDNFAGFDAHGDFHGFIPGHSFGQYISGLARASAVTGSRPTQEKIARLIRGYAQTVEPSGKFYIGYHLPAYTYDKTCCGLIDAHEFAHDPDALDVLWRSTQAALPHLPERALNRREMCARPHTSDADCWDESYTLPENLLLAYQRSHDPRYRELALRFVEEDYFSPLSEGKNVLPGEHAYSHVNAFSSAVQTYLATGDDKYLRAASNGLKMVQEQSFATGGWGPSEAFVEPGKGQLAESLDKTHDSFETPCGAYGHFKITRYLLRITADSRFGDSMERVLYNTIAGARLIQPDGTSFYYSDYSNAGARKGWHRDKWPCCSGTFPQLAADYGISSYYPAQDGIYVNLFIPSRVTWSPGGARCTLTQQTRYPSANSTQMDLALPRSQTFTIYLRIPEWSGAKNIVAVNGKRVENPAAPGKFLALHRTWKNGDRIELELDMPLRLEAVDEQHPNQVALLRGCVAMFAVGDPVMKVTRQDLLAATVVSQGSDDWTAKTSAGALTLRPFMTIGDEPYRLYQKVDR